MDEYREVTLAERQQMMREGVFDVFGNMHFHPGYSGIHRHSDGSYWFYDNPITDPDSIAEIERAIAERDGLHVPSRPSLLRRIWNWLTLAKGAQ